MLPSLHEMRHSIKFMQLTAVGPPAINIKINHKMGIAHIRRPCEVNPNHTIIKQQVIMKVIVGNIS